MITFSKALLIFLCVLTITKNAGAQEVYILTPGAHQKIAANDTALISWTVRPHQQLEFKVVIETFFEDSLATFLTNDTVLIIPPTLAPEEKYLMISIIVPGDDGYHNKGSVRREAFTSAGVILNSNDFRSRILDLLRNGMYPSAYFVYHRYKSNYPAGDLAKIFSEVDQAYSRDVVQIEFKDGKPYVQQSLGGAVHH